MEKVDFIEKAPQYYALAIVLSLGEHPQGTGLTYSHISFANTLGREYINNSSLREEALKRLVTAGMIRRVDDDFGPTVFSLLDKFHRWRIDPPPEFPLFAKVIENGFDLDWVFSALAAVNRQYADLDIKDEDFDIYIDDERWRPIPLDRENEKLLEAAVALDNAIRKIEQDNGYAVTAPEEREYVLESLKATSQSLKERSSILWTTLKSRAWEPLSRITARFGQSAVGAAASAAKQALTDWLKTVIEHGISNLFS